MKRKTTAYREMFDGFIVATVPAPNGDYECYCPIHEDPETSNKASARINFTPENGVYYPYGMLHCFKCGFIKKDADLRNIEKLYQERLDKGYKPTRYERPEIHREFNGIKKHPLPSFATRREYVLTLLESNQHLQYLKDKRGLNENTIKQFKIGWNNARNSYIYPVYKDDKVYAMRLYRPTDPKIKHQWYNSETEHTPQLHGTAGMEDEPVVILTEGEFDMYLARQDGFKAVTHNGGAGKFLNAWADWFKDKIVYIAYDADDAGQKGRAKASAVLRKTARAVYFIDFPGPKGTDYTDFRVRDGHTPTDFQALLDAAKEGGPKEESVDTDTGLPLVGKPVTIAESIGSEYIGIPLEMTVQVLGRLDPPYVVPARIQMGCTRDKGEKFCEVCPMESGSLEVNISRDNSDFIQRVTGSRDREVEKLIIQESGVKCVDRITEVERVDNWSVEQIVVGESVERQADDQESHMLTKSDTNLTMLSVDTFDSEVNEIYRVVGQNRPSPRDQRLAFTAWHRERTQTNIDQFEMDDDTKEMLQIFQPSGSQNVYRKMYAIAQDLTENVAGVVDRAELGVSYDVSWHSALAFNFGGKLDDRGWVELLVFGDTRTGKSETAHRLASWYRNGKVFSSEGASRAGLVGGATQPNGSKHWIATWGAIPQNDRRLIVLDEAQSLVDIVKDMGSIRSKGVAELVKVGINQSTLARTRLIWICNPLTQGKLDEFTDGAMTALAEFMPASEDRARFDLAIALSSSDVPDEDIHAGIRKDRKTPKYSSEACEKLILWAWSRKPDQILIGRSTESYILSTSKEIVEMYDKGNFELVQGSNMHVKLARIAVACALRVFSTDETGEKVIVSNKHVDAAKEIITTNYKSDALGLARAAKRARKDSENAQESIGHIEKWLRGGEVKSLPRYGIETYRAIRRAKGRFRMSDFSDMSGLGRDLGNEVVGVLCDMSLLKHDGNNYVKISRELVEVLQGMDDD